MSLRILVTGASGLLGANLVLDLLRRGHDVTAVSHRHRCVAPGLKSFKVDLKDTGAVRDLLKGCRPDWIVHCAALTNVDWCDAYPEETFRANADVPRDLAAEANRIGAGLVYVSTDSVFDGEKGAYSEEDPVAPLNVYAKSKLAGEQVVRKFLSRHLIVRTNFYGWNMQEKQSLAEWMLDGLGRAPALPGFSDVVFTPILVNDLGEILLDMIERRLTGLYHVTGSQPCSKYEFALALARLYGFSSRLVRPVSIADSSLKAPRPKDTSLNTDKVSQSLVYAMPDLDSGLETFRRLQESGYVKQLKALAVE